MKRMHTIILLLAALALPACFDTDGADELRDDDDDDAAMSGSASMGRGEAEGDDDGEGPVCTELEEICEVNGDCPCFDGSSEVGTGLCVSDGEAGLCTTLCQQNAECGTGCCATLEGDGEYGACAPAFVCEGDGGGDTGGAQASEECIEGVALFCACAASAGVPCSEDDIASFAATCVDSSHSLYDVFECWGGFASGGLDSCSPALDSCEIE